MAHQKDIRSRVLHQNLSENAYKINYEDSRKISYS